MPRKPKTPLSDTERQRQANRAKQATRSAKLRAEGKVPRQAWARREHWPEIMPVLERWPELRGSILELVERLHRG